MNLVQNIIAQTAFQSYYSLISNLLVQAPWNQLLDFNPIIVLFLTLIPAIHQDLRIDFNPIIVLFLTRHDPQILYMIANFNPIIVLFLTFQVGIFSLIFQVFQSYYSLISNSICS